MLFQIFVYKIQRMILATFIDQILMHDVLFCF